MQSKQVGFQFKGARNYIQGPDLFNVMFLGKNFDGLRAIRFSVHDFLRRPECQLIETNDKGQFCQLIDVKARCQFEINGQTRFLALVSSGDEFQDGQHVEYDESRVVSLIQCDGKKLTLSGCSPFTFIETIVSMNKFLLQSLFPEVEGKWIFTRVELHRYVDERCDLALEFKHNLNFRLTKSDILVGGEKIGEINFSLVKS